MLATATARPQGDDGGGESCARGILWWLTRQIRGMVPLMGSFRGEGKVLGLLGQLLVVGIMVLVPPLENKPSFDPASL